MLSDITTSPGLDNLPEVLLVHIISLLSAPGVASLSACSHALRVHASDDFRWEQLLRSHPWGLYDALLLEREYNSCSEIGESLKAAYGRHLMMHGSYGYVVGGSDGPATNALVPQQTLSVDTLGSMLTRLLHWGGRPGYTAPRIMLAGLAGAGKSTILQHIATHCKCFTLDLDEPVMGQHQRSIALDGGYIRRTWPATGFAVDDLEFELPLDSTSGAGDAFSTAASTRRMRITSIDICQRAAHELAPLLGHYISLCCGMIWAVDATNQFGSSEDQRAETRHSIEFLYRLMRESRFHNARWNCTTLRYEAVPAPPDHTPRRFWPLLVLLTKQDRLVGAQTSSLSSPAAFVRCLHLLCPPLGRCVGDADLFGNTECNRCWFMGRGSSPWFASSGVAASLGPMEVDLWPATAWGVNPRGTAEMCQRPRWRVQGCSALRMQGLVDALRWVAECAVAPVVTN